MTKEDGLQAGMPKTGDSAGTLVIGQMAVTAANTHLKLMGIRTAHKHIDIVIGLNYNNIGLAGKADSLVGDTAGIGHNEELAILCRNGKTASVRSIVRNLKKPHQHATDRIPFTSLQNAPAAANMRSRKRMMLKSFMKLRRRIYRPVQSFAERAKIADMVQMVMSYKHSRNGVEA